MTTLVNHLGFHEYERKARLYPGLLAVVPVALVVIALGWKGYPVVAAAIGTVGGAGATYLVAILVRHMGRQIEPGLWESWGGAPTTEALRTRTNTDNPVERDIWRHAVELCTGISLLTPDEEAVDKDGADQTIAAAVSQLTRLGQDPAYPLVKAENIQYGFERNYYALRWVGRAVGIVSVAVLVAVLSFPRHLGDSSVSSAGLIAGIIIDVLFLISWCVFPSKERTHLAGQRYSRQLYQAVVHESRSTPQGGLP
jgi:hypothetical protein